MEIEDTCHVDTFSKLEGDMYHMKREASVYTYIKDDVTTLSTVVYSESIDYSSYGIRSRGLFVHNGSQLHIRVSMATVSMALHSMHSEVASYQGMVMYKANGVKFWR